jgi:hypothetical protein
MPSCAAAKSNSRIENCTAARAKSGQCLFPSVYRCANSSSRKPEPIPQRIHAVPLSSAQ